MELNAGEAILQTYQIVSNCVESAMLLPAMFRSFLCPTSWLSLDIVKC